MIAPRRPPLPIESPNMEGPLPDDVVEVIAQVLLDAVERQERLVGARATEQNGHQRGNGTEGAR